MESKEKLRAITINVNKTLEQYNGDGSILQEYFNDILKDLELLEALKQRWQQEEWCQGIELSAESLNSLFKYNKDLFDRNLELDKKLESEFEDSADAICKALAERDKLLDENIELQQENEKLQEEKRYYKDKYLDLYNSYQNCEDLKHKKAIELLKEKFVIKFEFIPQYNYVRVCIQDSVDEISFVISLDTHKEQYDLLKEVFGE